jgi:glycerol uptake facilitator-like aquaporin
MPGERSDYRKAYRFTASTSFANPAVTPARSASDTFAGIRLTDVPGFIVPQMLGAMTATWLFRRLVLAISEGTSEVLMPHDARERSEDSRRTSTGI